MIYKFKDYKKAELQRNHLNLGGANPEGSRIEVTSQYLERGGKPWIAVMGEYHFSRASADDWYRELCKMKAGGVSVVSTYLFWIYHEEIENRFDFTGDLNIRGFVEAARRAGLDVFLRIGPWAHGECRNGGFPDWLIEKHIPLRSSNDMYMPLVRRWYEKIYEQIEGLLYKDGGNIIGIQLENELVDDAQHLADLKSLAREVGFDVPLYTVTGWNSKYGARIPVNEVMPVFGAYVDAPWAETLDRLAPSPHYVFNPERNDSAIGEDLIADAPDDGWILPYDKYPFATCELGAGIQPTHHRRMIVSGKDAYALSLVKLGCGNNLVGYYMYHGGINKIGRLSTFNESRATGYPNDYPILTYFDHTALTPYGEAEEQYGLLNLLHLFVNDFGGILAPMRNVCSEKSVSPESNGELRYCMRTDGRSGFVFINQYQRLSDMRDINNVIIDTGTVVFPEINVKGGSSFFMPFNMDLNGHLLEYAAAQPLCRCGDTFFFMEIEGIPAVFRFANGDELKLGGFAVQKYRDIKIALLPLDLARYLRRLDDELYIGNGCDIYLENGEISAVSGGSFSYKKWNGSGFDEITRKREFNQAELTVYAADALPFDLRFPEELCIGGERRLTFKRLCVSSADGFIEIPYECDAAQIYADGELIADEYYCGVPWRVPAGLLYGRDCYLVMSEMKDDFYREF